MPPTVGLCLGPYGGPRGVGVFLWAKYPCMRTLLLFILAIFRLQHAFLEDLTLNPEAENRWSGRAT